MRVSFRPAHTSDFDFCARLYAEDLALYIPDPAARAAKLATLRPRWHVDQVRIIVRGGADIGWLQSVPDDGALFIVQFFIEASLRGRGIGTEVVARIIEEAGANGQDVTLEVVKENRALRLYRRFGFQITGEDGPKYVMRRSRG
jgi:ribosomal protein S18 acetylase RimI-like enzyme